MKASFNPLFTDKTFSTTVPIKVRCSPETDAFRNMSRNMFGAVGSPEAALGAQPSFEGIRSSVSGIIVGSGLDGPGGIPLRVLPLLSPAQLVDQAKLSATTPQNRPPY